MCEIIQSVHRPKLSVTDQVKRMKANGITFDIISEDDAIDYLKNNTYFFKLKAYDVLFEKYQYGEKQGKYVNLDFAYLKELAIIDMHLRHFLLKATVDIEHCIKVNFLRDFNVSDSNGYEVVDDFFNVYPEIKDKILKKRGSSYCDDLIDKLESEGYALWNVVELLSFGDFIKLYEFFYQQYPECLTGLNFTYPMKNVKNLRNASAHNNCILDQINKEPADGVRENKKVTSYVSKIETISKGTRKTCMRKHVVRDFATMIYIIDKGITSIGVKNKLIHELDFLVNDRMIRHREYFEKNNTLIQVYGFIRNLVDNLKEAR